MAHVDDLSRSLVAMDQQITVTVVVELSQSSWLVAGLLPGIDRQPLKKLRPDPVALLHLLERWRAEATKAGRTISRVTLATRLDATGSGWRVGCRLAVSRCT